MIFMQITEVASLAATSVSDYVSLSSSTRISSIARWLRKSSRYLRVHVSKTSTSYNIDADTIIIPNCYCTSDYEYILKSSINILSFTIIISLIFYFDDLFIYA